MRTGLEGRLRRHYAAPPAGETSICTKLEPQPHLPSHCNMLLQNAAVAGAWGTSCTRTCTKLEPQRHSCSAACRFKMQSWLESGAHLAHRHARNTSHRTIDDSTATSRLKILLLLEPGAYLQKSIWNYACFSRKM